MYSETPPPIERENTKRGVSEILTRTDTLIKAQLELRKQSLSSHDLAEFELSLQNWVVEYLWPAPKVSSTGCAAEPQAVKKLPLYAGTHTLKISRERWFRNLEGDLLQLQCDDRILTANAEFHLSYTADALVVKFIGLPFVTTTGEVTVKPDWVNNEYTVYYGHSFKNPHLTDAPCIIFS